MKLEIINCSEMKIELRIALRYIITKRSFHFISVITILSLIGITVGVAALITVLSIFNGFQDLTKSQFIGFDPHIKIIPKSGMFIKIDDYLINQISSIPEVKILSKSISGKIVGIKGSELQPFTLVSIPNDKIEFLEGISKSTVLGDFVLKTTNGFPAIIMGNILAERLNIFPGDTLKVVSPKMIEQSIISFQRQREISVVLAGIFNSNIKDYDIMYGFSSDTLGKMLLNPTIGSFSSLDIKLNDIKKIDLVSNKISEIFNQNKNYKIEYHIQTWQDLNPDLFAIMRFERFATFSILSLIVILAVFNVLVSLTMTVTEKRKDIGILKAVGASNNLIKRIFLYEGMIIGSAGTIFGTSLGLFLCWGQINLKWFKIDGSKFIIDAIPVIVNPSDVIFTMLFSLLLTSIATIYPAYRASTTKVIESLRTG